jgi:hyperosmotically inducible protein
MNIINKTAMLILTVVLGLSLSSGAALAAQHEHSKDDHSSNVSQGVSDTWITTKVKTELATTEGVSSTDISVKTEDGKVTLIGNQPNETAVKKAVSVTKSVKGVKDVDHSGLKSK